MSEQLDTIILPDDEETALIEFESHDVAMTAAHLAATTVGEALDYLHSVGADSGALDDIHCGAFDLLLAAEQLHTALGSAVSMAKTFREQREEFRVALAEFKHAVETADTSVPEIEQLWQAVEENNMEWLLYSLFDEWEKIVEELINTTPLDEHEARALTRILGSEELPPSHTLWTVLREWIADAQQAINEEHGS